MPPLLQPEFFILLGLNLFLAVSLLACLLDRHFPWQLPYLYQIGALAGFGQLLVSKEFMLLFGEYMRFWYSLIYLAVALASVIAINIYIGLVKKLITYAKVLTATVSLPAISVTIFFVSSYAGMATHPLVMTPQLPWETTFIAIVGFDAGVIGLGTYVFFKPKWWYIATGAGAATTAAATYVFYEPSWVSGTFVLSAIALTVACIVVLGISVYILGKMWLDTWKEKRKRR